MFVTIINKPYCACICIHVDLHKCTYIIVDIYVHIYVSRSYPSKSSFLLYMYTLVYMVYSSPLWPWHSLHVALFCFVDHK